MSQATINYMAKVMEDKGGNTDTYLKEIDKVHHEVHEGCMWTANYLETSFANDGIMRLNFTNGSTKNSHLTINIVTEGKAYFKTYTGTTFTGGTTQDATKLTVFNRRTDSTVARTAVLKYNVTISAQGTLRGNQLINGGTGGTAIGAIGGTRIESVLGASESFEIELQNKKGQTQDMQIVLDWYEE